MPVSFTDLLDAFEFASMDSSLGDYHAIVCRQTGKIYTYAEDSDLEEFNDELPDDIADDEKYITIPDRKELGLGKPLALSFAREHLPDDFDDVRFIFSKRGAYRKFRTLLEKRHSVDLWYAFEAKAKEQALRDWCALNGIPVGD